MNVIIYTKTCGLVKYVQRKQGTFVIICGICQGGVDKKQISKRRNPMRKLHKNKAWPTCLKNSCMLHWFALHREKKYVGQSRGRSECFFIIIQQHSLILFLKVCAPINSNGT